MQDTCEIVAEVPAIKCDKVRISEGVAVGRGNILNCYLKKRDQIKQHTEDKGLHLTNATKMMMQQLLINKI